MSQPPDEVEPWELHSELVLVSPEVFRRAIEELPERDPDAFLTRSPAGAEAAADERGEAPAFIMAALGYTLWRLGQTVRFGLLLVGVLVALALLVELLH